MNIWAYWFVWSRAWMWINYCWTAEKYQCYFLAVNSPPLVDITRTVCRGDSNSPCLWDNKICTQTDDGKKPHDHFSRFRQRFGLTEPAGRMTNHCPGIRETPETSVSSWKTHPQEKTSTRWTSNWGDRWFYLISESGENRLNVELIKNCGYRCKKIIIFISILVLLSNTNILIL